MLAIFNKVEKSPSDMHRSKNSIAILVGIILEKLKIL